MAQLTLPFTLVAGTPENVNNVQSNFTQIKDHINNALIGDDNLTSPNNAVPRSVFQVAGSVSPGGDPAGTYVLRSGLSALTPSGGTMSAAPIWIPNTADVAVAGKTTQVRLVAYCVTNATAPAVNFTVGLTSISSAAGGIGAITFSLSTAIVTAVFTTPAAGNGVRAASSWATIPSVATHCFTVALSGTSAANSMTSFSAILEMRHT